jgi:hypothetical protein
MFRVVASCIVLVAGFVAGVAATSASTDEQPTTAEAKAVAFLSREVPRWRKEHPCYSCHNNGDAARALITASRKGHDVSAALADTLTWLRAPARWNDPSPRAESRGEKMPQGGIDDKPLARIQFASALGLAVDAKLADRATLADAARFMIGDQKDDGSWQLDSSQSLGSPTTYGTVLATAAALRSLRAVNARELDAAIAKGDAWLRQVKLATVIDAAAAVLGLQRPNDEQGRAQEARALDIIRRGEAPSGGWGPYVTSPPQVFDTALVMLALDELSANDDRRATIARGRSFLLAEQLDDGSWPETTRPSNQESYAQRISTTGWALLALLETEH